MVGGGLVRKGWIKVPRCFQDSDSYGHASDVCIYVHALMRANLFDTNINGIELKPGEFLTSVDQLSRECGLTEKTVRCSLERLKKGGQLGIKRAGKGAKKGSVITVVNYGFPDDSTPDKGEEKGEKKGEEKGDSIRKEESKNSKNNIKVYKDVQYSSNTECADVSARVVHYLSDTWERFGLVYNGTGSLEGMMGKLLKDGYSQDQIEYGMNWLYVEVEKHQNYRRPIKDQAAYFCDSIMPTVQMKDEQPF